MLSQEEEEENAAMRVITAESSRKVRFAELLESIASGVDVLVNEVEESTSEDPVAEEHEAKAIAATLLYCADNLGRIEETILLAMDGEKAESPNMRSSMKSFGLVSKKLNQNYRQSAAFSVADTFILSSAALGGGKKKKPKFTKKMIRRLTLFSTLWQILQMIILMIMNKCFRNDSNVNEDQSPWVKVTLASMVVFQLLHVITTISVMFKIGVQVAHHTISMETLVQSYLTTIITMAGVYFLYMAMDTGSFVGIDSKWSGESPKHLITSDLGDQWALLLHLAYFSCTVMTGCGFGDITPRTWYAVLTVTLQQLLSVTFSTVIFGLALQHFTSRIHLRRKALERKEMEGTNK